MSTLIIAEAGVNHNGQIDYALKLVDIAADAGADIVKFQTFKAKNLVTKDAKQSPYQIENTGIAESQYNMLSRLELSYDDHFTLLTHCNNRNIRFLSTAFDHESLDFLVNDIKLDLLKIPSGEITNLPFILAHAQTQCPIILSTGMSNLADIEIALGVIAFGYLYDTENEKSPSIDAFYTAYQSRKGQQLLKEKVTVLHCTTEYPAPFSEINLNAMNTIKQAFGVNVGYSDHSKGIAVSIAAAANNASVIEKHFTMDTSLPGPDHKASLSPEELNAMVIAIRQVEQAMGSTIKAQTTAEIKNVQVARKSLVASQFIKAGTDYSSENIDIKRPGNGVSPTQYWNYLNKSATRDYAIGELIDE